MKREGSWSRERVLALAKEQVTTDIVTAAAAIGISRSTAYTLVGRGEFPVTVLKLGQRFLVRTSDLLELLGLLAAPQAPAINPTETP